MRRMIYEVKSLLSKLLTVFEVWMWFYGFLALFFNEMVTPLVMAGIVTCLRQTYKKIRKGEVFTP